MITHPRRTCQKRRCDGIQVNAADDHPWERDAMGHADANTTARYDRRGERAKRHAVRMRHMPCQRGAQR